MNLQNLELNINYKETNDILLDARNIIDSSLNYAYRHVNVALIERNWLLGLRITREELKDTRRENYGLEIIKKLSKELTAEYGTGFTKTNLYNFLSFYKMFPDIFHAVRGKSLRLLTWTHYRILLQVHDDEARNWYEEEAKKENWSYRVLQRNINTQYYYRLLKSHQKDLVKKEMINKTKDFDNYKLEFIKSPVIAEFLGFKNNTSFTESDIETSIINNLQKFMMELGKGYAFVGRQEHIHTEKSDYFIDLIFYNYMLKCFVLIDLKTSKITHQDIGQMDMYVRMYDELKKDKSDNPTIGIVLCTETDEDIARYSILNDSNQLFATKYKLYLPTELELKREIEKEKTMFYLKQKEKEKITEAH